MNSGGGRLHPLHLKRAAAGRHCPVAVPPAAPYDARPRSGRAAPASGPAQYAQYAQLPGITRR